MLNTGVCILLVAALYAVKNNNYQLHKNLMLFAMFLSVLFLVTYIAHHLFAGEAKYGDANFDGTVDALEAAVVGNTRPFYLILLRFKSTSTSFSWSWSWFRSWSWNDNGLLLRQLHFNYRAREGETIGGKF